MMLLDVKGKDIVVVGAGRSGIAVARFLKDKGAKAFVTEKKERLPNDVIESLHEAGIEYETGGHSEEKLLDADLIVVSPGVPLNQPVFLKAGKKGIKIYGELEIAARFVDAPIIAVTGTNGKSTTVSLVYEMLKENGFNVEKGGNIGTPLISFVESKYDWLVVEVSSFQLETIEKFHPVIAGMLNITPDHLDRHGSMREYAELKMRIFSNQGKEDLAFINKDDENVLSYMGDISSRVFYFSMRDRLSSGVWIEDDWIVVGLEGSKKKVIKVDNIPLLGCHNVENVMLASGMAIAAGAKEDAIQKAVRSFKPLPHRMELVREIDGVIFVDDSKGTNVDATIRAVESFDMPVILIAGGLGKKGGYKALAEVIKRKVKMLVLIGEDAPVIADAVSKVGFNNVVYADTLKEAVNVSYMHAKRGDCVLLSPACASYDMFRDYKQRGEVFKKAVMEI